MVTVLGVVVVTMLGAEERAWACIGSSENSEETGELAVVGWRVGGV
jgi:hypothetical protein